MRQTKPLLGLIAVMAVLMLGLLSCGSNAPKVDWTVGVTGAVGKPLTLSYADLAGLPQIDLKDILMDKSLGEDVLTDWSGVPLAKLFEQAGAADNYVSVTVTAADGYAIEITRDELQDAIVALKQDDKWIATVDQEHGPLRLVCPKVPANRWVFQLQEIKVNAP